MGWPAFVACALAALALAAPAAAPAPGGVPLPETANCTGLTVCTLACQPGQVVWVSTFAGPGGGVASCGGATASCIASTETGCGAESGPVPAGTMYGFCVLVAPTVPPGSCGAR